MLHNIYCICNGKCDNLRTFYFVFENVNLFNRFARDSFS